MAFFPERKDTTSRPPFFSRPAVSEFLGLLLLALLVAYFLRVSWRKWPDPIVDNGAQWYAIWRVSLGAVPYHDFVWNYGPLSLLFNGLLFKCFGPGMMVLVTSNLLVYGAILSLAYVAFRIAWGRLAAFAASAVFISVFSFSILNGVGNYNFATPYSHEATHGLLLMLVTAFIAVRWCAKPSPALAFLLGLCGGLSALLKPEFMLAGGVLGIAALFLRHRQRQPPRLVEYALLLAGVALPTLGFTAWFARGESWKTAFIDSCQAWWLVLVNQRNPDLVYQPVFLGFDHPWRNASMVLQASLGAVLVIGAIWAAGWLANRPWRGPLPLLTAFAAIAVACCLPTDKSWFEVGRCLPGLIVITFAIVAAGLRRELRQNGHADRRQLMALGLVLLAGAMLARMPLRPRVYHFGFFQAAFAGMVSAAVIVSEVPRWTGPGALGRRIAVVTGMAVLAIGSVSLAAQSARIRSDQTQPVASGRDRFYAFDPEVDETGLLVDWSVERLRSIPPAATLLVLPEGVMINYLSRHVRPMPEFFHDEDLYVKQLSRSPPDYVILITRDLREFGIKQFGAPGNPGQKIVRWLGENYLLEASHPGRAKWAALLRKKPAP
jgi:hypothetical protein